MKCYLVCDVREQFPSENATGMLYNDHPSLANVKEIVDIIRDLGNDCEYFGGVYKLIEAIHSKTVFDNCFFLNFSDGLSQSYARVQVPVLCEVLGVPYSGSSVFASALMNNKYCTTAILRDYGMKVPDAFRITKTDMPTNEQLRSILPVFIKPNTEGSSVGITSSSMQPTVQGACLQIQSLQQEYDELIVERYIQGVDATVFVIGNHDRFKLIEPIVLKPSHHDYLCIEEKSERTVDRFLCKDIFGDRIDNLLRKKARAAFQLLECRDIARFDFRIDGDDIYFIEANTCPRISRTSEAGFIAKSLGFDYACIVKDLLNSILYRLHQS